MARDGLFLEVPLLPADEAGLAEAERLAGVKLRERLYREGDETREEAAARHRRMHWPYLQGSLKVAIIAWFASLEPAQRARMDPRLLERFPDPLNKPPPIAQSALLGTLYELLNSPFTIGAFWVDADYQIKLMPQYLDAVVVNQLLEAVRDGVAYRICDHCGRPFAYKSERAQFCSGSCKTLAWRKRREEGGQ